MHLSSHLSAVLGAVVLAVLFVVTSSRSLTLKEKRAVHLCSSHMACAWAICPYKRIPSPSFPDQDSCMVIENKGCRCASRCQLTDLMEPGRAHVKYEFRCMSPEVTREIFPMGRRRRQTVEN